MSNKINPSMVSAMREYLEQDAQALSNINAGLMVGGHKEVDARYRSLGERAARLALLAGEDENTILLTSYEKALEE